jgi:hypothetical protein
MFLIIASVIYFCCIYAPPLVISEKTTRITSPLTESGQIDFFHYLEETCYPPELATDDNGYKIFVQKFGDIFSNDEFYKKQKYEKLGLDINIPPTMKLPPSPFQIIREYFNNHNQHTILHEKVKDLKNSWTLDEFPMLSEWVAEIDEPLDAIAEMIRKPVFFFPYLQDKEFYNSSEPQHLCDLCYDDITGLSNLVYQYQTRANYRIAGGDIDGAIDDKITICKLARHLNGKAGIFVELLVSINFEGIAYSIQLDANCEYPITKEQLQRFRDEIDRLPPRASVTKIWEAGRIAALDAVGYVMYKGPILLADLSTGEEVETNYAALLLKYSNLNIVYTRINEAFDTLTGKKPRSELNNYYFKQRLNHTPPQKFLLRLFTANGRGRICADIFIRTFISDFEHSEAAFPRINCTLNMKHLTWALLMYKTEHGEFPKSDWIEKIKPYLGDNFEQYLHCPSCLNQEKGKTNYALILYDKLPSNKNAIQLIELREQVSFDQAVITRDEVLQDVSLDADTRRIGGLHYWGLNIARQNGSVTFLPFDNKTESIKLLGLETENESDNNY